ncbi:MAG TPA: DUF366 family protein [Syntrophomonadaceae bacterium]|nr:DUF366 family protein [Syntrophomonadaceae bacterium]
MKTLFIDKNIDYLGIQLAPHWIYNNYNLLGDAAVSFIGEADVSIDHMVDLTDVQEQAFIYSPLMLHFILEHFDTNLTLAIFKQRMLMVCIKDELEQYEVIPSRIGDDLYINKRKLSVSIATRSVVSTLIHVGLNIETAGTPVPAIGLKELNIPDIKAFAENVLQRYKRELEQIKEARSKVRGVLVDG